jgi:hypothetical protein
MKTEFVKIQKIRYRLANIKRYEPFDGVMFGINIFFSTTNFVNRGHHKFDTEKQRDEVLDNLDEVFNTK